VTESNNLSQQKTISLVDCTTFPDKNYLISEIHGVLRFRQIHKITKLENHEGNEITAEELVDEYYKDPDKYFGVNGNKSNAIPPSSSGGGGTTTAIDIFRTSIQPLEVKIIKKTGSATNIFSM
jgi:hypothetical protein